MCLSRRAVIVILDNHVFIYVVHVFYTILRLCNRHDRLTHVFWGLSVSLWFLVGNEIRGCIARLSWSEKSGDLH